MAKSTKELAKELGLLRKRPLSVSSPRCLRKRQKNDQRFSYLIIIDFESTCWENDKLRPQEIIEFPAVVLNTQTGQLEDEFHFYLQPLEFPTLSSFCQQLTGISQNTVDEGIPLSMCLKKFVTWLGKLQDKKGIVCANDKNKALSGQSEAALVTWSDWDLGVCLLYETRRKQISRPSVFNSWIDLRATYRKFYSRRPEGLNGALKELGIEFEGRQHSGLDDAKNTARLAWRMICDGCNMAITKSLKTDKQGFVERISVPPATQKSVGTTSLKLHGSLPTVDSVRKTKPPFVIAEDKCETRSPFLPKGSSKGAQLLERNKNIPADLKKTCYFKSTDKIFSSERGTDLKTQKTINNKITHLSTKIPVYNRNYAANVSNTNDINSNNKSNSVKRSGDFVRRSPRRLKKNDEYQTCENFAQGSFNTAYNFIQQSPRRVKEEIGYIASESNATKSLDTGTGKESIESSEKHQISCSRNESVTLKPSASTVGSPKSLKLLVLNSLAIQGLVLKDKNQCIAISSRNSPSRNNISNQCHEYLVFAKSTNISNQKSSSSFKTVPSEISSSKPSSISHSSTESSITATPKLAYSKTMTANGCFEGDPQASLLQSHNKTITKASSYSSMQDTTSPNCNSTKGLSLSVIQQSVYKTSRPFRSPCFTSSSIQTPAQRSTGPFKTPIVAAKSAFADMRATPPLCLCGRRSKRRQVQNCGPNMGRLFFTCSIGRPQGTTANKVGCGFFQWDSPVNHTSSSKSAPTLRQFSHLSKDGLTRKSLGVRPK